MTAETRHEGDVLTGLRYWLLHEQARFASSNDPSVKAHIAQLKKWQEAVDAAAHPRASGEPVAWRMVPIEPVHARDLVGDDAMVQEAGEESPSPSSFTKAECEAVWRRMIRESPLYSASPSLAGEREETTEQIVQRVKEACAQVADRAADRHGLMENESHAIARKSEALRIAQSIRALIPAAPQADVMKEALEELMRCANAIVGARTDDDEAADAFHMFAEAKKKARAALSAGRKG